MVFIVFSAAGISLSEETLFYPISGRIENPSSGNGVKEHFISRAEPHDLPCQQMPRGDPGKDGKAPTGKN
jgi:hypothetical protein